jgi:alpha-L-rhamnosidase
MPLYVLPRELDVHYAFRSSFVLPGTVNHTVCLKLSGIHQFIIYIDGEFFGDGPSRFTHNYIQYTEYTVMLKPRKHTVAILLQYYDLSTRILSNELPPFLYCCCNDENGNELNVDFKFLRLSGYDSGLNIRMSICLGYMEWCENIQNPCGWEKPEFDDSDWSGLEPKEDFEVHADVTRPVKKIELKLKEIGKGYLTEDFGYEKDFVQARFFLRRLENLINPPQGKWKRYDLGSVKLGRTCFTLDLPEGATVEIAACEEITHNRVYPFISLTGSQTCNMAHFTARGGVESFMPLTPLGGRYIELHILCLSDQVNKISILSEKYYWRTFFDEPVGSFKCNEKILEEIWELGINTLRSCTEDVITDCPIRERGQWTGDSAAVGLRTTACGYGDMQVVKKSLVQATYCTDNNGILPALFPGHMVYCITYGFLWVCGCMDYYRYTGDNDFLEKIYPAAVRFINYINSHFDTHDGILKDENGVIDCGFIDWGYEIKKDEMIIPVIGMYYEGIQSLSEIESILGFDNSAAISQRNLIMDVFMRYINVNKARNGKIYWQNIGYHGAVMLLKAGAINRADKPDCIEYIKKYALSCFPNNPNAPRLYNPTLSLNQIITPYFYHFTLWALMENGEDLFVYNQIKKCWGYMIDLGETTCLEVFDTRWSHCHQWSACPTWLLSCYGLGLHKSFELGQNHFTLRLMPDGMKNASGIIPLADGGKIKVSWAKNNDKIDYSACADRNITIHTPEGSIIYCKNGQTFSVCL